MPACAMISVALRIAVDERVQAVGDRRQARPPWIRIGT